jgi:Flp pilus assembly protein TadG
MRALTLRRAVAGRLAGERGAVAVMVALLFVPLLGCGAIAVDVASLYSDREQLQTAADAAAIAVALDCAGGACGNPTATATTALTANAGAADTAGATLRTPTVSISGTSVTVTVSADQSHWFAPVLGVSSSRVSASSTATWTASSAGVSKLPLALSWCEYKSQIAQYPLTSTTPHRLSWITPWLGLCAGPTGNYFLGGGHALTDTDSTSVCRTTSSVGDEIDINLFVSQLPSSCTATYLNSLIGTDLQIPVYDDVNGWLFGGYQGHVYGYTVFHLTGYTLTTGEPQFTGYFTRGVQQTTTGSSTSSAPYLGSGSVHLSSQG